ncbi:hypothetical protein AAF712_012028 [Marasmius tenuissimus]|uniref:Uncharacterized protein n=1 Tax=Marasmius tenuissimus TaxID=585030 RepID=A0ABR2ZKA7_9AGAR
MPYHQQSTAPFLVPSLSQWQVVSQLDRIGRPPIPFRVSHASVEVLHIIEALGILSKSTPSVTRSAITPHIWRSRIEPWIKALLIASLIGDGASSSSINIHNFRAEALRLIPACLNTMIYASFPFTLVDSTDESYALTPQLQQLLAKTWLNVVREGQPTIDSWSVLFMNLKHEPNSDVDMVDNHALRALGPDDASSFIRHVASVVPRLPSMDTHEFSGFAAFMYLFADIALKSRASPSQIPGLFQGIVGATPLLSRLLTKLLRMKHDGERRRTDITEPVSLSAMFILTLALDGPVPVSQAVASGLLSIFFKRPHRLATLSGEPQKTMCALVNTVSRFIVYPEVLHEFSRAVRKGEPNFNSDMCSASLLWECWRNCLEKAAYVYDVRQNLKSRGALYRCSVAAVEPSSSYLLSSTSTDPLFVIVC